MARMLGIHLIEVCDANEAAVPALHQLEEKYPVTIIENACMTQCELCAMSPYVFFNGEIVTEDNIEALMMRLEIEIQQALALD